VIHVLFKLYDCNETLLNDKEFIENLLYESAVECGATFLKTTSHQFDPHGVTAVCLLAESHISIHTWPETSQAVCDIFTCGDGADPMKAFWYMHNKLECNYVEYRVIDRESLTLSSLVSHSVPLPEVALEPCLSSPAVL
jgi:S-adenosylmethionine decarboxylase